MVTALLDMAKRSRRGKVFAQLNPSLISARQPILGQASRRIKEMLVEELKRSGVIGPVALAVLLIEAIRERSVRVAQDETTRAALQEALSDLVQTALARSQTGKE